MMDIDLYQERAMSTALDSALNFTYLSAGATAELGEALGILAKHVRDNPGQPLSEEQKNSLTKEIGDVYWFLALFQYLTGIRGSDVLRINAEKLLSRKQRGVIGGSGDDR